jgi:peptide/nickel transport system substrate-binding protein
MGSIWMISPSCYDSEGKFKEAIGTGPFIPVKCTKQDVIFKSNPDYWGGAPIIQKVTIKLIPDATTQIMALEAGELDLVGADISGVGYSDIKRLEDDPKFAIYTRNEAQIEFLGFNVNSEFFSDKRVREAVNYGIDRQSIKASKGRGMGGQRQRRGSGKGRQAL